MGLAPSDIAQELAGPHGGWYAAAIFLVGLVGVYTQSIRDRAKVRKLWKDREEEFNKERARWDAKEVQLLKDYRDETHAHLETLKAGPQIEHLTKLAHLLLDRDRDGSGG